MGYINVPSFGKSKTLSVHALYPSSTITGVPPDSPDDVVSSVILQDLFLSSKFGVSSIIFTREDFGLYGSTQIFIGADFLVIIYISYSSRRMS